MQKLVIVPLGMQACVFGTLGDVRTRAMRVFMRTFWCVRLCVQSCITYVRISALHACNRALHMCVFLHYICVQSYITYVRAAWNI